ncbi:MBL fold metallo-hydrolase [Aspergillus puulaauensis]|uniref:Metallo-beta-lactamase domain-containing protein n=1 Tax=Aspergillus puulaauensis TaxID=1220207 RepID=A0A7R7XUN3_9EURO|nr:uncharacterized protein APUU_61113S [Aspergillus puulaauensis]BCS28065.1 hypothetical protein APUU_61113S [Aspergillus puulaauensis]
MAGLHIPVSDATVRVRMVNTSGVMVVNAKPFIEPVQSGHETLNLPVAAFLLDHGPSGRKIMFDLGVRKEYWKLPASLQKRLGFVIPALRVDEDTTEILEQRGVALGEISSVIWSHYHWDHTGSMELFPKSTQLVVGPGFKASPRLLPGFPENIDSPIDSRAIEGRELREIVFDDSFQIGGFRAHDFFGDGSFYLLDTPGHCLGHICGLARTTPGPESTFVLLGGDICHFPGVFRPSPQLPLPDPIPSGVLDSGTTYFPRVCPCSLFAEAHPLRDSIPENSEPGAHPFYHVSTDESAAYIDPAESQRSVEKLVHFDTSPDVLVCLAHDETMLRQLPTLNEAPDDDLNGWRLRGYKERVHWGWLNELSRGGKPGRPRAIEGFWRDKKVWEGAKEELKRNGESASGVSL